VQTIVEDSSLSRRQVQISLGRLAESGWIKRLTDAMAAAPRHQHIVCCDRQNREVTSPFLPEKPRSHFTL
jgi:hypothetical protein